MSSPSLYGPYADGQTPQAPPESASVNAGPEAPAPQVASPNSDPSIQPEQQQQMSTPGQPVPAGKPPFWKTLLQGALNGLAGSAGAHNWGQALGMGVQGEQKAQQLQFENQQQAAQAQQQAAVNQSNIKFRDAQSAYNAAQLAAEGHKLNLADQEAQDAHDKVALQFLAFGQKNGQTYHFVPGAQTMDHMSQQTANDPNGGAHVPSGAILTSRGVYVPDTDAENSANSSYDLLKSVGQYYGLPAPPRSDFFGGTPQRREQIVQQLNFLMQGKGANGAPADPKQLGGMITNTQMQLKKANEDQNADPRVAPALQLTLQSLENQKAAADKYQDDQTNRQIRVAGARGTANNMSRVVDAIDPETSELRPMTNAERLKSGAVGATSGMQAGGKQAQLADIQTGSQTARKAITELDSPLSANQVSTLTLAMKHDDPTVVNNLVKNFLGTERLTDQQKNFVTAIAQLNERALSLRNLAGMGQGSDQMRAAIQATLPGATSGDRSMMLKQLNAFDQQVQQLGSGVPTVRGLAGHTSASHHGNSNDPLGIR